MTAARLFALGRHRSLSARQTPVPSHQPTGACELDMEMVLAGGTIDVPPKRAPLWVRIVARLKGVQ